MKTVKTYKYPIGNLRKNQIFVFGTNTDGIHDSINGRMCLSKYGAIYRNPSGLQGNSYALPIIELKTYKFPSVDPETIVKEIKKLYEFAKSKPNLEFLIEYTVDGYNSTGYTAKQLANMFSSVQIPKNIIFEENFAKLL